MGQPELYEKLRVMLGTGPNEIATGNAIGLPKHEVIYTLLTNMFTEQEAEILVNGFQKAGEIRSLEDISEAVGMLKLELKEILSDMRYKGKIISSRGNFMVIPLYPGGFEVYFTRDRDDPERKKKVAEAHFAFLDLGLVQEYSAGGYSRFRVIPSAEPTEKTIEINKSVEAEKTVLPYEILKQHILNMKTDQFAVVPCPDRVAAKLAGRPCKRTDENFCVTAGPQVKGIVRQGVGKQVSLDELMELLERAEKEGLVHQTTNIQDSALFLCNCCSCCCPALISFKKMGEAGASARSNFEPRVDRDECALCDECVQICPMEAIYHHYPHREDGSDEYIMINTRLCLGCGVCASNCPSEAITLEKVREVDPLPGHVDMIERIAAGREH
jgi:Pyruvate/2-oxoacid:ferredoxin oxidoreductase delta subunit